jgi:hypothetical protein
MISAPTHLALFTYATNGSARIGQSSKNSMGRLCEVGSPIGRMREPLEALNDVLIEKGYDLSLPAAVPAASANSKTAKKHVYHQAAKGTSSTGLPIPETHGAAQKSATLAAAGGAKSAGGGGMAAGLKNIEKAGVHAQLATYEIFGVGAVTTVMPAKFGRDEVTTPADGAGRPWAMRRVHNSMRRPSRKPRPTSSWTGLSLCSY